MAWTAGASGVTAMNPLSRGRFGEVTGFDHAGPYVWVVLDGESEPRKFWWSEVRPA